MSKTKVTGGKTAKAASKTSGRKSTGKKKASAESAHTQTDNPQNASTVVTEHPVEVSDFNNLSVVAPPETVPTPAEKRRLNVWAPVEGLATGINSLDGDNLEITVSAEMYQAGGSVWLRALVDGRVAQPSDVLFKSGNVNFDGVRSFTFVQEGVSGGQHLVEIQMRTGSAATIRDRILTVHSGSPSNGLSRLAVAAAPSGPPIKAPAQYDDITDLATVINTKVAGTLAITFSAEAWADSGRMMVRAMVDDVETGEVIFAEAGDSQRGGTRSFTFVKFALAAGIHRVKLQWRSGSGVSRIGDRTMSVSAAHRGSQVVTVAEPPDPVTLTQTTWTEFHPGSIGTMVETTDSISNIAITVSTEVLSNGGRVFMRALVDGQPTLPNDVTLIEGGPKWRATAHTFVAKNVGRGRHRVRVQLMVDPQTMAKVRRRSTRIIWKRRRGADFVQPFLHAYPRLRSLRLLVIGFDPMRPHHMRPSFEQIRNTFEGVPGSVVGDPTPLELVQDGVPNLRDWLRENSGGIANISQVRYVGCQDGQWYIAPPERQGNWYWDNMAWDQMWKDALSAADAEVDFHAYDTDQNNRISEDELVVAIVRPQNNPYGTLRGTDAVLDGIPAPLNVPILDLYLSSNPAHLRWGVGVAAHELAHHIFVGAHELYGVCPNISPGKYSVMDAHWFATHLDPFWKMKNGLVQPLAIDLDTQTTTTWALPAVELRYQVLLLHDSARVAREYFLIENRYPGDLSSPNYDSPIGAGAVVVWQIFEDLQLVQSSAVCPNDPRFVRKRAILSTPADSFDLAWSDGTPAGFRVSAPIPNAELAQFKLQKL